MEKTIFASRIGGAHFLENSGYKMEEIKAAKRRFLSQNPGTQIFDFGIGEPDKMPPQSVLEELSIQSRRSANRIYADNGCDEFKVAAARFMENVYGVSLDSSEEVIHCIGAKSALSLLPLCLIDPGDLAVVTVPGYPIFKTHVEYLGGKVLTLPLLQKNRFLPDLDAIPPHIWQQVKVLSLNYPNNPTSAEASLEFFQQAVEYAQKYHFLIINDAAYASLTEKTPLSLLQVKGAKDVGIEIHSMSKAYNMTGWRLGWVCGNPLVIKAFARIKDNSDSGQFLAIQKAATKALEDIDFPVVMAQRYQARRDRLVRILETQGFHPFPSQSGFFVYVPLPKQVFFDGKKIEITSAKDLQKRLLSELGILVIDWDDVEPAIRFSLTFESNDEETFFRSLEQRFQKLRAVEII